MPYLSRVWLNPLRRQTQRMLNSPQVLHAALLNVLSQQPVTERVLWRLENENKHKLRIIVLTQSSPSFKGMIEEAGWENADEPQALTRPYDPLLSQIAQGREFTFRLTANPTSCTKKFDNPSETQQQYLATPGRKRGIRVAQRSVTDQMDWLTKRLEQWGFAPVIADGHPAIHIQERRRLNFPKADNKHKVVLHTATFTGRLRVYNPETARKSLLNGVGPAKAYGCGLITLAPINSSEA